MGAQFVGLNCFQNNSPIVTNFPLVLGCWTYNAGTGASEVSVGLINSSGTNNYFSLGMGLTPSLLAQSSAAGTIRNVTSAISPVTGQWYFELARFISSTNRWLAIYDPSTGLVDQVQNTVSSSPTIASMSMCIGGMNGTSIINPTDNTVAEVFYMDADFRGSGGAALSAEYIRKLALEGPFSCPDISDLIVEYRSLRWGVDNSPPTEEWGTGLAYSRAGLQTWALRTPGSNKPVTGAHPPFLSPNYVLPPTAQTKLLLMV